MSTIYLQGVWLAALDAYVRLAVRRGRNDWTHVRRIHPGIHERRARESLPYTLPHQILSSSAVINPMVSGMLALDGDALEAALTVRQHIPQDWTVQFDNYRAGQSNVSEPSRVREARHEFRCRSRDISSA